jgi:signal transduction histidine kinase
MKFRQRLLVSGFIISFMLVAALAVVAFVQTEKLWRRVNRAEHAYLVVNAIGQLNNTLLWADKSAFRYLALRDSRHYDDFTAATRQFHLEAHRLQQITRDNPQHQDNVVLLQTDVALYLEACRRLMGAPPTAIAELTSSDDFAEMQMRRDSARSLLGRMSSLENHVLQTRTAERENYLRVTTKTMRTLSVIFGALTVLLFTLLLREFGTRLYFQDELQEKVAELGQSKQELEHIAYATSHDLQEPLRKIRILLDKWLTRNERLNGEDKELVDRVVQSAARMQGLVAELMMLASLNADEQKSSCPLSISVEAAALELETVVEDKAARIDIDVLPTIKGYPDQLRLLFRNLLDNALKFSRSDEAPEVSITWHEASGEELPHASHRSERHYYCISVQDNGIGFDNKHVGKIFGIFRQLHASREGYSGKGTGLAVCQRIMTNHRGYITAHSFPGEGATFKLYFPMPD